MYALNRRFVNLINYNVIYEIKTIFFANTRNIK